MSELAVPFDPDDDPLDEEVIEGEFVPAAPSTLGFVVSDDRSPTFEELRFRLLPGATVTPGQFVAIVAGGPAGPSLVVSRVLDVHG
jgi:hypothetical protein